MSLIDTDALKDCVEKSIAEFGGLYSEDLKTGLRMCVYIAEQQPERKKGTWIIKDNPGTGWYRVTCSECGEDVTSTAPCIGFYPNAKVTWDYCPNCGADMREVEINHSAEG